MSAASQYIAVLDRPLRHGESQIEHMKGRRYKSPDGSERYLVDAALLSSITGRLGAELVDPLKTTVVDNQRAMTTWVLRKKQTG